MLTLEQLRVLVAEGEIDTVVLAFTDLQGRLVGKRLTGTHFIDQVAAGGAECCSYLLAVDVEMNTVGGYAIAGWDSGYGDLLLTPDFATLRRIPWLPGTAQVQATPRTIDGAEIAVAPRAVLAAQLRRLHQRGLSAYAATELEFLVFDDDYRAAFAAGYRNLHPATDYNVDYALSAGAALEPLLRDIRRGMTGAGLHCEGVKGECHPGQQEITFRYADALTACDNHVVYKNGAKEIAAQHGKAVTFMAKYDRDAGNSCHIHLSLRDGTGRAVFADEHGAHGMSALFRAFLAGVLDTAAAFTLCYAPNINSYKRLVPGSFAPTAIGWGIDNRTCAVRVIGHGDALRLELRVPGGDVNPYLAVAALIAGGLHGIEAGLTPPEPITGDAYRAALPQLPANLAAAAAAFDASAVAHAAFGDDVVAHYLNAARIELAAFGTAVTDWERVRGFERL